MFKILPNLTINALSTITYRPFRDVLALKKGDLIKIEGGGDGEGSCRPSLSRIY